MPSPIIKGIPTIIWGTANQLGSPAGAVVQSISITPKNAEPIEIEDNNGFTAAEIVLDDGFNARVSILADTAKQLPAVGGNVALSIPSSIANGNIALNNYSCLVASVAPSTERKREAMIDLNLVYRPGVAL